jgi:predicted DNA-binding protein (MmcQ/YjbR family)
MSKTPASRIGKLIRKHALSYPEATEEFPWGEHAFKVNRKTFVFMRDDGGETSFSVKLSHSRRKALQHPGSEPTHYGMGAKGWVTLRPTSKTTLTLVHELIDESYRAVAPKRALKALPKV